MTLSVVVPVHNADKYLCRCIDSLLVQWPQDRDDYEIICVNDGSTDRSNEILRDYQSKHPQRIIIVEQENRGLPAARNAGMEIAHGEILAFCDADDWVYAGAYYYIYTHAWDSKTELLRFRGVTLDQYVLKTWVDPDSLTCDVTYEGEALGFLSQVNVLPFVWLYFYRRSFLVDHHICTKEVTMVEDILFNLDVFVLNPNLRLSIQELIVILFLTHRLPRIEIMQ